MPSSPVAGRFSTAFASLTGRSFSRSTTAAASSTAAAMGPPPVRLIPASSLHVSKPTHWLESRFHFSFADYWNPKNNNFGALRVLNDDLVKPRNGFG